MHQAAESRDLAIALRLFAKDLNALPESAFDHHFGGSARTVADIVYEVNMVNDHIGLTIRGEDPFPWPEGGWITAPETHRSKEAVLESFRISSEKIIATAKGFTDEDWDGTVTTEQGEKTRRERIRFITLHLWYHCGQLNFMQSLLGDSEWHWK
jgi:uncharacterized damage-inducible protein DinB